MRPGTRTAPAPGSACCDGTTDVVEEARARFLSSREGLALNRGEVGIAVNRIGNDGNNGYYEYGADYDGDYEEEYDYAADDYPEDFGDPPEVRRVA